MSTPKARRHSQFQAGQGAFKCECCGRLTRDTGDNGQCRICPQCYDLGGLANAYSDNGGLDDSEKAAARQCFTELASHLGSMEVSAATEQKLYDYVFAAEPEPSVGPNNQTTEFPEESPGDYFVYVGGIENDPDFVMVVDAPNSYQARRVAKRLVARHRSIDGLTFSAQKA